MESSNLEASRKATELADYYLGGTSHIRPENFDIITDMFTDAFVTYAVECFAQRAQLSQTVYQYRYSHLGQYGLNVDQGKMIRPSLYRAPILRCCAVRVAQVRCEPR